MKQFVRRDFWMTGLAILAVLAGAFIYQFNNWRTAVTNAEHAAQTVVRSTYSGLD